MAIEIKVPPLGESLVDAVVGQWLKGEGDAINRGETIVELETDKVNLDVAAEDDGVLSSIQKQEGETVTVGEVLAVLEAGATASTGNGATATAQESPEGGHEGTSTDASAHPAQQSQPEPRTEAPVASSEKPVEAEPNAEESPPTTADIGTDGADGAAGGRAAPAVRRLAEEHAIDLGRVAGSGPGGRITRDDLLGYLAQQQASAAPAPAAQGAPAALTAPPNEPSQRVSAPAAPVESVARADEERVRLSRRRQTIAARLVEAQQTAAMLTTFNEVDMTAVMELRAKRRDAFKERHGVGLGSVSFLRKAVIGARRS